MASNFFWPLYQLDVRSLFLHSDLQENIHTEPPLGSIPKDQAGKVCCLKKVLYDLKQSPQEWFKRFSKEMMNYGYKSCQTNHTVHQKMCGGKVTIFIVDVDDTAVRGSYTLNLLRQGSPMKKLLIHAQIRILFLSPMVVSY